VLARRVYDLIGLELKPYLNYQPGFFVKFANGRFSNAFERMNLPTGNYPRASLWILVSLPKENATCFILNQKRGTNSWKCIAHQNIHLVVRPMSGLTVLQNRVSIRQ